jgi:hypothetical protein
MITFKPKHIFYNSYIFTHTASKSSHRKIVFSFLNFKKVTIKVDTELIL